MKNTISTILMFLLWLGSLSAQYQIERQVIGTSGNFASTANHQVSSTVGEVATASFIGGTFQLNQGFQQSGDIVSSLDEVDQSVDFKFYPNPTPGTAFLELEMPMAASLNFDIIDVTDRQVSHFEKEVGQGAFKQTFDLNHLSPGTYFLRISAPESGVLQSIKFIRIR